MHRNKRGTGLNSKEGRRLGCRSRARRTRTGQREQTLWNFSALKSCIEGKILAGTASHCHTMMHKAAPAIFSLRRSKTTQHIFLPAATFYCILLDTQPGDEFWQTQTVNLYFVIFWLVLTKIFSYFGGFFHLCHSFCNKAFSESGAQM